MLNRWRRPAWPVRWRAAVRRGGPLLLAAACGIALAAGSWYGAQSAWRAAKRHPYFAMTHIEVAGNSRVSRAELLRWAGVADGDSVWDADPTVIQARLQSQPWFEHVSVQRDLPRALRIHVHERTPVAIADFGGLQFVDRGGHVLGPLRDDDSRDFPIITGLDPVRSADFATIGLHRALRLLRSCQRLRCFDTISEVRVDHLRGLTVFPVRSSVAVLLGWGSWREKLTRSARVFAAWDGQVERLASIDVSIPEMVIVTLRADHHPANERAQRRGMRV